MFIRIKKRNLADRRYHHSKIAYDAVLLETYRDEEGKVKQRQLKHLGSIQEYHLQLTHALFWFYEKLDKRLIEYGINDPNVRDELVIKCESRLGKRPTEKESEESLTNSWKEFHEMKL